MTAQIYGLLVRQIRTVLVWYVLFLSTLGAWLWMEHVDTAVSHTILASIIGLAAIKVVLVIYYYMEINHAPRWLQALCATWLSLVFGMILLCYLEPEWVRQLFGF